MAETANTNPQPAAAPPTSPASIAPQKPHDVLEDYHTVADTVGLVPSLRVKDNVLQALFMLVFTPLCAGVGFLIWGIGGLIGGLFAGLLGGILISGIALMILGWVRAARRLRR